MKTPHSIHHQGDEEGEMEVEVDDEIRQEIRHQEIRHQRPEPIPIVTGQSVVQNADEAHKSEPEQDVITTPVLQKILIPVNPVILTPVLRQNPVNLLKNTKTMSPS